MEDLESIRQANIVRNKTHLESLGIFRKSQVVAPTAIKSSHSSTKRRKRDSLPASRVSARIASAPVKPAYVETEDVKPIATRRGTSKMKKPNGTRNIIEVKSELPVAIPRVDFETVQAGWTTWTATASSPTRDDDMVFHFEDQPTFVPNKSPEEMLREGCFGGSYFRPLYSRYLGTIISDDYKEIPKSWYDGLDVDSFLISPEYDPEINKYKVKCGQSIEEWEAAGWIDHKYDVRGWFQWYCRFFQGRRCDDDERQISRWRKCVGETGRWRRMLLKKYVSMRVREVFDDGEDEEKDDVSPVMHQTCFHWAYEVRQGDLDRFWETGT